MYQSNYGKCSVNYIVGIFILSYFNDMINTLFNEIVRIYMLNDNVNSIHCLCFVRFIFNIVFICCLCNYLGVVVLYHAFCRISFFINLYFKLVNLCMSTYLWTFLERIVPLPTSYIQDYTHSVGHILLLYWLIVCPSWQHPTVWGFILNIIGGIS